MYGAGVESEFSLPELALAYRKAKADIFYDTGNRRLDLAEYESGLEEKLQRLVCRLNSDDGLEGLGKDKEFLGGWTLAPAGWEGLDPERRARAKRATDDPESLQGTDGFAASSDSAAKRSDTERSVRWVDPLDEWRYERERDERDERRAGDAERATDNTQGAIANERRLSPTAEFRIISECSIEFHIVSALWIRRVGAEFERQLSPAAIGRRLRRTKDRKFSEWATGSFPPYLKPYREWQSGEYNAIERELNAKRPVVAVSADFKGFFHNIDARFLTDQAFYDALGVDAPAGLNLRLHEAFVAALRAWAKQTRVDLRGEFGTVTDGDSGSSSRGLPVGMASSAVIANLALHELDQAIERDLKPVYYGRYVDDLSIVLRDSSIRKPVRDEGAGKLTHYMKSGDGLWQWVAAQIRSPLANAESAADPSTVDQATCAKPELLRVGPDLEGDKDEVAVFFDAEYLAGSKLKLNAAKSSQIHLTPDAGESLMRALRRSADERSSEWRMLPDVPLKSEDVGPDVLRALTSDGEETDALRKVDGLRARRAAFALRLRDYTNVAEDTQLDAWSEHLDEFLTACRHHIVNPEGLMDYWRYTLRLVGFVVRHKRWDELKRLLGRMNMVVDELVQRPVKVKSFEDLPADLGDGAWMRWRSVLAKEIEEVLVAAGIPGGDWQDEPGKQKRDELVKEIHTALKQLELGRESVIVPGGLPKDAESGLKAKLGKDTYLDLEHRDLALRPFRHSVLLNPEGQSVSQSRSVGEPGVVCSDAIWGHEYRDDDLRRLVSTAREGLKSLRVILEGGSGTAGKVRSGVRRSPMFGTGTVALGGPPEPVVGYVSSGLMFPTRPFTVQELVVHALPKAQSWEDPKPKRHADSNGDSQIQNDKAGSTADLWQQTGETGVAGSWHPNAAEASAPQLLNGDEGRQGKPVGLRQHVGRAVAFGRGYSVDETLPRFVGSRLGAGRRSPVQGNGDRENAQEAPIVLQVGKPDDKDLKRTFALAVVDVPVEYVQASAMGLAVRSLERYRVLARLVNDALRGRQHADYVVFPELSIPYEWFTRFATKLAGQGIGLIAGVDYLDRQPGEGEEPGKIRNEIWLSLAFQAEGFPGSVTWRQPKLAPAPVEATMLRAAANLHLNVDPYGVAKNHLIVENKGFRFSVLNCAELTDVSHRARLRGHVDALVVPEYNKDIGTFNSLVEAASTDIHAFIVQCNVRPFGDTRIRAPYAERWRRDIVQIKGGTRDLLVQGEVDFGALRRHQTQYRAEPEPSDGKRFKPCPSGFEIAEARRLAPREPKSE